MFKSIFSKLLQQFLLEFQKPMHPIPHPSKYSNSSEKPYQCNTCKKTFSQQSNLCKHQLIHFGVKPYGCDTCGKRFTQQANLIKHKRIHTGDKPFTCKVCQRQFSQNANLKKHMQLHTGEKRYRCEFCDKAFVQQANLERHRRTHTGEKPFSCEVCQKKFTQKGNLVKHEVIHYLKDNSRLASQFQTKVPSKEVLHNLIHVADLPSQSTSNDGYHKKMGAPVIVSAREGMFVKRFWLLLSRLTVFY